MKLWMHDRGSGGGNVSVPLLPVTTQETSSISEDVDSPVGSGAE